MPCMLTPATPATTDEIGQILHAMVLHAMEYMLQSISKSEEELKQLALTDSLTGIANLLKLNNTLTEEIQRTRRCKQSFSVIMFDGDYFKSVNDTFGHEEGDHVLLGLASLISGNIRATALVGDGSIDDLLKKVDTALYASKEEGRNRVTYL